MRQRITMAGVGFTLTILAIGTLAFLTANNLLFLLLSCLLAALLVSGFLNRLSLAGLAVDFAFPDHVCARRETPARLRIHNEKGWVPSFSIHVAGARSVFSSALYFPVIPAGEALEEPVAVRFARRGIHDQDTVQVRSRFPFGFSERRIQVTLRRQVVVYPSLDPQPTFAPILAELEGEIQANERGRGYDFYRIRPYEPTESARHVDWRATAHTGELQVREYTREKDPLVEVFLDLAVESGNLEWFERAVDCCAYLCWEVASRGARLRFRSADFDVAVPVEADVYAVLKYLALVEPRLSARVPGPGREDGVRLLVSADPARARAAGWEPSITVGPGRV
jgi:uncharacterized protein (DUF58 family)